MARRSLPLVLVALFLAGCSSPNKPNIELRKKNQDLRDEVSQLQRDVDQLRSQLRVAEQQAPTVESLPQDRLDTLFTAAGVKFGRLTGREEDNSGLLVFAQPTDGRGDNLKAAGGFVVEAFDLSAQDTRIGRWEFPLDGIKNRWQAGSLFAGFRLECPWEGEPVGQDKPLTIKLTFTDGLTGRVFTAQQKVE